MWPNPSIAAEKTRKRGRSELFFLHSIIRSVPNGTKLSINPLFEQAFA